MRCKNCEHLLFNQPAPAEGAPRVCTECGAGYRVADFAFRRGKVQFCCPGCGLAYYGTSPAGHLEPERFSCVGCGLALDMDRCVLKPYGVGDDEAMQTTLVPWEGQGGWLSRWWKTARLGLRGAEIAIAPSPDSRTRRALGFLILNSWVTAVPGIAYTAIMMAIGAGFGGVGLRFFTPTPATIDTAAFWLVGLMLLPLFNIAFVAAAAGCATLSGVPFHRGVAAFSYASGTQLLLVVPFCGGFLSRLLWIVQGCRGMAILAPEGRAVGAVFTAIVGALAALGAWWFVLIVVGSLF
ncbi:MAG: hypothetical protein ACKOYN_04020 [Planctomycetota bacterium]